MEKVKVDISEQNTVIIQFDIKNNSNDVIIIESSEYEVQNDVQKKFFTNNNIQLMYNVLSLLHTQIDLNVALKDVDLKLIEEQGFNEKSCDVKCNINISYNLPITTGFVYEKGQPEYESQLLVDEIEILDYVDISLYESKTNINLSNELYEDDIALAKNMIKDYIKSASNYDLKQDLVVE